MTLDEETEVLRDAVKYLRKYENPVKGQSEEAVAWWTAACTEITELALKWKNDPFAINVFRACFLETETRANS